MGKSVGSLEQLLMFATARLADRAHGRAIREAVEEATHRSVSHGALYATMERLERQGLVRSWLSDETPDGGGRRRKRYEVTPEGARTLRKSYEGLRRIADDALDALTAIEGS